MIVTPPSWEALSLMNLVASQPIAAVKFGDRLTQTPLSALHAFLLITAFRGMTVDGVRGNRNGLHRDCVAVKAWVNQPFRAPPPSGGTSQTC
jgi:hypothetical protein